MIGDPLWRDQLIENVDSSVWTFIALDYYERHVKADPNSSASEFLDDCVTLLADRASDPLEFHRVLVVVAAQLLNFQFNDVYKKSVALLGRLNLSRNAINDFASHYAAFGAERDFRRYADRAVPTGGKVDPVPNRARDTPVAIPDTGSNSSIGPYGHVAVAAVSLLIAIALLLFMVRSGDWLQQVGLTHRFYYVLLIPLGISAGAFAFGAMRSFATFSGRALAGNVQAGGVVVAIAAVVVGGFYLVPSEDTFAVTARVLVDDEPVQAGNVLLQIGANSFTQPINANGEARFVGLPTKFRRQAARVVLSSPGFRLKERERAYSLSDELILVQAIRAAEPAPATRIDGIWRGSFKYQREAVGTMGVEWSVRQMQENRVTVDYRHGSADAAADEGVMLGTLNGDRLVLATDILRFELTVAGDRLVGRAFRVENGATKYQLLEGSVKRGT